MYLRQTRRKNKDGATAHYLQLAHNVRDPDTGVVKAQILHSFGRAEHVEREALERLIASIARCLEQDPPLLASTSSTAATQGCLPDADQPACVHPRAAHLQADEDAGEAGLVIDTGPVTAGGCSSTGGGGSRPATAAKTASTTRGSSARMTTSHHHP